MVTIDDDVLVCPSCGESYLHQTEVTTYWRDEDANTGLRNISSAKRSLVDDSMAGNPSDRRQGLTIRFDCESCDATPVLTIVQHKGNTFLRWKR